jgi:hypothetical protein
LGRSGDVPCVNNVSYASFTDVILASLPSSSRCANVAAFRLCESYQQGSSTQDKLIQQMLENRNKQWWRGRKSNNGDEDNIVYDDDQYERTNNQMKGQYSQNLLTEFEIVFLGLNHVSLAGTLTNIRKAPFDLLRTEQFNPDNMQLNDRKRN